MPSQNLKFIVDADTSRYSQKIKGAKSDLKSFESTSRSMLDSIGNAFGVNTRQIEQMGSAIRGMGAKLTQSGNEGVAAFGKMLSGISKVSVGIAGLGIGAAVAHFKALNNEATYFKSTVEGGWMQASLDAYISTYKGVFHDFYAEEAKGWAVLTDNLKKTWAQIGQYVGNTLLQGSVAGGIATTQAGNVVAKNLGTQAAADAKRLYEIERELSDLSVRRAELEADIAEQRTIAWDTTYSEAEQLAAITKMEELIREKTSLTLGLEQEKAALMVKMNDYTSSTPAQIDAANQQRVKAFQLERQMNQEIASLLRRKNSIVNATKEQVQAESEVLSLLAVQSGSSAALQGSAQVAGMPVLAGLPDYGNIDEVYGRVAEMTNLLTDSLNQLADTSAAAIGELVGNLINGSDAWSTFGNAAIGAFADLAITVGKIAIQTGIAESGIVASLKSLNPTVAIAGGAALVALGYAAKTSLANAASGSYSASGSVASGGYQSSGTTSTGYETKDIRVIVSGKLKAEAGTLTAVLEEDRRQSRLTT